jgi:hypothetical protein
MSLTWSGYKELSLKITEPLKDDPHQTRRTHMEEEKKYDKSGISYQVVAQGIPCMIE